MFGYKRYWFVSKSCDLSCVKTTFYVYRIDLVDVSNQLQLVSNHLIWKRSSAVQHDLETMIIALGCGKLVYHSQARY